MLPATPKLALAPMGVPVIHPPPVTKSLQGGVEPLSTPHVIPADAEPKIRFTPVLVMICKALTVMSALPPVCETACSLMITMLPSTKTTWFAAPLTVTLWPSMIRPSISDSPTAVAPIPEQLAVARAITKSTVMRPPAKKAPPVLTLRLAAEASEAAVFSWPMVAVWIAAAEKTPATLSCKDEASCAPPETASDPLFTKMRLLPRAKPRDRGRLTAEARCGAGGSGRCIAEEDLRARIACWQTA